MALTTLDRVKRYLNITTSDFDGQLTIMLNAAIAEVTNYCRGIDFEQVTRTEYYQPDGDILTTRFKPIQSLTAVYEDGDAKWGDGTNPWPATSLLVAGSDYALIRDGNQALGEVSRTGRIQRIGTYWLTRVSVPTYRSTNWNALIRRVEPAIGSVKVVYVSGYTSVPLDVEMAVMAEVDAMRARAGKGGQLTSSETLGEYSYTSQPMMKSNEFGVLLSDQARILLAPWAGMRLTI